MDKLFHNTSGNITGKIKNNLLINATTWMISRELCLVKKKNPPNPKGLPTVYFSIYITVVMKKKMKKKK